MKVNEYSAIRNSAAARRKGNAGATGNFADLLSLDSTETSPSPVSDVSASMPVGGILGLQEISGEESSRKQLVKHGNSLLDSLEQLRHSLLTGRLSPEVLRTLDTRLNNQRQLTNDPLLLSIIDDIELRAAVELAKLDVAIKVKNTPGAYV